MKKRIVIISLIGLFVSCSNSNAQSNVGDIDLIVRKGIYLSFDDFIRNAPSVSKNFNIRDNKGKINEHFDSFESLRFLELYFMKKLMYIEFTNFNNDTLRFDLRGIWGFSTGEAFFLKGYYGWYRIASFDVLCQLEFYEKKDFFYERQYYDKDKKFYKIGPFTQYQLGHFDEGINSQVIDLSEKTYFGLYNTGHFLNLKTGKIQYPFDFAKEVEKIIESDEQLFQEFTNDTIQYESMKIKTYKYFLLYRERNPVFYPVIQ